MDALLSKLTNLGYEFFGILLPGCVFVLALMFLWIAAGDMLPAITAGILPHLTFEQAMAFAEQLVNRSGIIAFVVVVSVAYFFGHLLTWIARGGKKYDEVGFGTHLFSSMIFRPPKLKNSYKQDLEKLFQSAGKKLFKTSSAPTWVEFYPVAKMYLMQKASHSLIHTYQIKYTLHRAFAVTAAITVWGCLAIVVVGIARIYYHYPSAPSWPGVISLFAGAILAVWGFSSSYLYNWQLWGGYIITETYTLLRDESNDESTST